MSSDRYNVEYPHSYIRNVITDELEAFPGVTKTMLNLRLKIRLRQSNTKVIDQMIEDGEIVVTLKNVHNLKHAVRVLYLANKQPKFDSSMVNSSIEQILESNPYDTRY